MPIGAVVYMVLPDTDRVPNGGGLFSGMGAVVFLNVICSSAEAEMSCKFG